MLGLSPHPTMLSIEGALDLIIHTLVVRANSASLNPDCDPAYLEALDRATDHLIDALNVLRTIL